MAMYYGFNTINAGKKFKLTDFDLIKQDLSNAFNIKRGEKLMNPSYGSGIQELLFDPLDSSFLSELDQNVRDILDADPRINATNLIITPYENGVQISVDLTLIETNQTETMVYNFTNNGTN